MSALHFAVEAQDIKLVNLLVTNYADIRSQNKLLQSPLHLVCMNGNFEIFKTLIDSCYHSTDCLDY